MRHYIIYIKWENSQFEGYVYQELGLDVVEKIESPDFNQFIQLAEILPMSTVKKSQSVTMYG